MISQTEYFAAKLSYEIDPSDLFEVLQSHKNIVVLDVRGTEKYNENHIPGSIHLPHSKINKDSTADFDKSLVYVIYCDGVGCNAAIKGCFKMSELGFQVKELMGGIAYWIIDGYATEGSKGVPGQNLKCAC